MKNIIQRVYTSRALRYFAVITPFMLTLAFMVGCTTGTPVVSQQPVLTATYFTNSTPAVTNVTTGVVTPPMTVTNVTLVTNLVNVTNTYYVPNTNQIAAVASTLQAVNSATAAFNPYAALTSPVISWGAAAAGILAAFVAGYKNNTKSGIITAITSGIESAAGDLPDSAPITVAQVKASVQKQATLLGNVPQVHSAVQANT